MLDLQRVYFIYKTKGWCVFGGENGRRQKKMGESYSDDELRDLEWEPCPILRACRPASEMLLPQYKCLVLYASMGAIAYSLYIYIYKTRQLPTFLFMLCHLLPFFLFLLPFLVGQQRPLLLLSYSLSAPRERGWARYISPFLYSALFFPVFLDTIYYRYW